MKSIWIVLVSVCNVAAFFAFSSAETKLIAHASYPTTLFKGADEIVNNSDVLQDDNALTFPVEASGEYEWKLNLTVTTSAGFTFQFTGPTSPTFVRYHLQQYINTTNLGLTGISTAFSVPITTGGLTTRHFTIWGHCVNGVNAGNITFQWAQAGAAGSDTTVLRGATLAYKRLGLAAGAAKFITDAPADPKPYTTVTKASNETVTSSAVMQDDDHLSFAMDANGEYQWELTLYVTTNTTADFRYTYTGPASPTAVRYYEYIGNGTGASDVIQLGNSVSSAYSSARYWDTGAENIIKAYGYCLNGANAGTLQLRWAQGVSDGVNTIVQARSKMKWRKIN